MKRISYKKTVIRGVPNNLKFTLEGMFDHLKAGEKVKIIFNGDGTYMTAEKVISNIITKSKPFEDGYL